MSHSFGNSKARRWRCAVSRRRKRAACSISSSTPPRCATASSTASATPTSARWITRISAAASRDSFSAAHPWRLPLRAYHGGMFFKNGVPAGYVELLSLFERAEVGFNLYYTFREGESAWLYARILRLFNQVLGVKVFSVDPYQIGLENPAARASWGFLFIR